MYNHDEEIEQKKNGTDQSPDKKSKYSEADIDKFSEDYFSDYQDIDSSFYTNAKDIGSNDVELSEPIAMEDISSFYDGHLEDNPFRNKTQKRKLKKRTMIIISALVLVFTILVTGGIFVWLKLNKIKTDSGDHSIPPDEIVNDDRSFTSMNEVLDAKNLDDLLKKWATNGGQKMSNKNVINLLLLGLDSEDGKMKNARSDAIMLVSLNKKTKTITLLSFFRDSYIYANIGKDRYVKLTEVYYYGGANAVIETLENAYKIEIDNYVSVDFKTFPEVIDALGGVTVEVKQYEANYIQRDYPGYNIKAGPAVKLNGRQALIFSRIRHSDADADVSRTRRQRSVISAIIASTKDASIPQLNSALDEFLESIKTDMKRTQILSLGTQAITYGWMNYEIQQAGIPSEAARKDAMVRTQQVWVVDYPLAAYEVQTMLYGVSNIKLDNNRQTALQGISKQTTKSPGSTTTAPKVTTTIPSKNTNITTKYNGETTTKPKTTVADESTTISEPTTGEVPTTKPTTEPITQPTTAHE